jgi:hypothetical protein
MLAYCTAFGLDRGYLVYAKQAPVLTPSSAPGHASACAQWTSS